jgi:hypothetical protein
MTSYIKDRFLEIGYFLLLVALSVFLLYHTLPVGTLAKIGIRKPENMEELSGISAALLYGLEYLLLLRMSMAWMLPGWHMKEFRNAPVQTKAIVWCAFIIAIALGLSAAIGKA